MSKITLYVSCLMFVFLPLMVRADIKSKVQDIDKLFYNKSYSIYYVQLMVLSKETRFDPPPNTENFEDIASAIINIRSHSCYHELRKLIDGLKKMELEKYPYDGYPRWLWRIKGPSGYKSLSIMVDVDKNILFMDGQWYVAKPEMIYLIVDQFVSTLSNTMKGLLEQPKGQAEGVDKPKGSGQAEGDKPKGSDKPKGQAEGVGQAEDKPNGSGRVLQQNQQNTMNNNK